jgi:hypothetical protein
MTAPTITLFANLTAPTTPELDNNFLAYAVFGNIPCAVTGTNSLVMVQDANTPALTQLTNYLQFSGVFADNNTGPLTIVAGGFGVLPGYKDTPSGPAAFSGGECITGNAFTARYDSALNTGSGGYHVTTNTGFSGGTVSGPIVFQSPVEFIGGSVGVTLSSSLLTGNSLTLSGLLGSVTLLEVGASASSVTRIVSGVGSVTYSVTPASSAQNQNFALVGAQIGDSVAIGLPASPPAGAGFTGFMAAAGTVTLRLINPSTVTLGAATITVRATAIGFT